MFLDEIKVGDYIEVKPTMVEEKEMLDFSNRFNPVPIHVDSAYAETTKFGKVIASGMMSFLVVWANYIPYDFAGEQLIAGKSSHIEWYKPVFAGDVLKGKATVTAVNPRNDYNGIMEITIDVYNQNQELVLKNVTESVVSRKMNQ